MPPRGSGGHVFFASCMTFSANCKRCNCDPCSRTAGACQMQVQKRVLTRGDLNSAMPSIVIKPHTEHATNNIFRHGIHPQRCWMLPQTRER